MYHPTVRSRFTNFISEHPFIFFATSLALVIALYFQYAFNSISPTVQGHPIQSEGVDVYVLDSGVNPTSNLDSNIGFTQRDFTTDAGTPNALVDCSGHGTIVSNILARESSALDIPINVHSLKVFGCADSVILNSVSIHSALLWVLENHNPERRGVVNMSLHFGSVKVAPANYIIDALNDKNIIVVTSAGNDGGDACNYAPGNLNSTLTVGNIWVRPSDNQAKLHGGSNSGECVDIYSSGRFMCQPTEKIRQSCTGTSYAAPVIAARVAGYIMQDRTVSLQDLRELLLDDSEALNEGKFSFVRPSPDIREEAIIMHTF